MEPNARQIQRQEEAEENAETLKQINTEIAQILEEKNRITLLISKGCGDPVSFRKRLVELEARENELRCKASEMSGDSMTLHVVAETRDAIGKWKKDGDLDKIFTAIVDTATVKTGEYVTFNLKCGMKLTEPLGTYAS